MTVSCVSHGDRGDSALRITISLTPVEAATVGDDAKLMVEIIDSCLWAMGMLRSGVNSRDAGSPAPVAGDWTAALRGVDRLPRRVRAIRDAVTRTYAATGGTTRRLADALGISGSAARHRRARIAMRAPDTWEEWATAGRNSL
ncbi:hypothetical protein [Phaeacidiphilus oryzae]|uniref:hypothetical protein n=1 Tax=Phaeacidiphilus oryzae TaxID=348818 RepID=UPI00055C0341|nr:hypothetical protein [Phaeacidiphilus oryzae]